MTASLFEVVHPISEIMAPVSKIAHSVSKTQSSVSKILSPISKIVITFATFEESSQLLKEPKAVSLHFKTNENNAG
jgi:hypothetical protein